MGHIVGDGDVPDCDTRLVFVAHGEMMEISGSAVGVEMVAMRCASLGLKQWVEGACLRGLSTGHGGRIWGKVRRDRREGQTEGVTGAGGQENAVGERVGTARTD